MVAVTTAVYSPDSVSGFMVRMKFSGAGEYVYRPLPEDVSENRALVARLRAAPEMAVSLGPLSELTGCHVTLATVPPEENLNREAGMLFPPGAVKSAL